MATKEGPPPLGEAINAYFLNGPRRVRGDPRRGTRFVEEDGVSLEVAWDADDHACTVTLTTPMNGPVLGHCEDTDAAWFMDAAPLDLARALFDREAREAMRAVGDCSAALDGHDLEVTWTLDDRAVQDPPADLTARLDLLLALAARLARRAPKIDLEVDTAAAATAAAAGSGAPFRGGPEGDATRARAAARAAERAAWLRRQRRSENLGCLMALAFAGGLVALVIVVLRSC